MKRLTALALFAAAASATPAQSAVLGFDNVALSDTPTIFQLDGAAFAFTFDAAAAAQFDPNTYSVQTFGTGETSAFFGQPSVFFTSANILIDNNLFPSFAAIPTLSEIPFSLTPSDLALRYSSGTDFFFGFARLNSDGTLDFAFESQPNTAIIAGSAITGPLQVGAVPEPGTWAMMLFGFGALGTMLRRRRRLDAPARAALAN